MNSKPKTKTTQTNYTRKLILLLLLLRCHLLINWFYAFELLLRGFHIAHLIRLLVHDDTNVNVDVFSSFLFRYSFQATTTTKKTTRIRISFYPCHNSPHKCNAIQPICVSVSVSLKRKKKIIRSFVLGINFRVHFFPFNIHRTEFHPIHFISFGLLPRFVVFFSLSLLISFFLSLAVKLL